MKNYAFIPRYGREYPEIQPYLRTNPGQITEIDAMSLIQKTPATVERPSNKTWEFIRITKVKLAIKPKNQENRLLFSIQIMFTTKESGLYQRIILNLVFIFSIRFFQGGLCLSKKNPNFTLFLVPIELLDLHLNQKFCIKNSEKKVVSSNRCNIAKILKVITEGNNVVLIEVVIMIHGTKHLIMHRKNKKVFAFFSSWKWFINYNSWDKSLTVHKNIQFDEKDPHIIYRLSR